MGIAGSVSDDYKWFYPDKTGFMFDTPPMNVASGRGEYAFSVQQDWQYYGGRYLGIPWNKSGGKYSDASEHVTSRYNGVLNWLHKYEIDNRFLAYSDNNAHLNQFPEVQYPWKFTEYVFVGMGDGYEVVEPPLYDPATLKVVNGIENPENVNLLQSGNEHLRKEGKITGYGYEEIHYEPVYYFRCKFSSEATDEDIKSDKPVPGPDRKQYEPDEELRKKNGDLESGLIVDGKKYPPWTDPAAHYRYRNTFINTQSLCGTRKVFKFTKPNRGVTVSYADVQGENVERTRHTGIRLYRKDLQAKCISMGQHGNIPPFTINMSAPKDYIDPKTMYRNTVDVIVTYEAGQAMYAENDGFIYYKGSGNYYNTDVSVAEATFDEGEFYTPTGKTGKEWEYKIYFADAGDPISQPKPGNFGAAFKERCYGHVPGDIQNGELIHKGCPFFIGDDTNGCYCSVKKSLLENGKNPLTHPDDFMGIFGEKITEDSNSDSAVLFDPGVQPESPSLCMSSGESPSGSACRMYAQQGPREILEFMCDEMSNEEFANSIGFNQNVETTNQIAMGALGLGIGGAIGGLAIMAMTPDKIEGQSTSLAGMSVRKKVRYEYKEVNLNGKEITGQQTSHRDTRDVVPGSGKFALDKENTSAIGGVDTPMFGGTNLLSRTRFCSPIMQCYNAKYCNKVYGTLNLKSGLDENTFAGVGSDKNYCRYYNEGCPTTEISQRAREYDREYKRLLNLILAVFRISGIRGFKGLSEVACGNYWAAVGNCKELNGVVGVPGNGGNIYFIYDKKSTDPGHLIANVYAFITQYPAPSEGSSLSEDSYYKMNRKKYPLMSVLPSCFGGTTEIPWLVKLHDDYVSPTKSESYATNLKRFIGGRMSEYKDFSRMGQEIQCTVTEIQEGYDGDLTSGKGGSDEHNDYTTSTSYQYYRVDASGEWIIESMDEKGDGLSIGEDSESGREHGQARAALPPGHSNGATPIKGSYRNSSYSQEKGMIRAVMTQGWCFSNDDRKSLEEDIVTVDDGVSDEPKEIPNAKPPTDCLPLERDWYYCPSCSPKPYSYYQAEPSYDEFTNTNKVTGEININQIFTDFEYQQYGNCPRCNTALKKGGKMKHFAKCRAQGIVNYFGLPGELVDTTGFFWKNHTEVSRTFISEILSKNGSIIDGKYARNDSASGETESAVQKLFGKGENYVKGYVTEAKRLDMLNNTKAQGLTANASEYALTNTRTSETPYAPSFMRNNVRMDGLGKYHDRYISPYPLAPTDLGKVSKDTGGAPYNEGMEFVSANAIKSLRNMVMPWQAYPCYDNGVADSNPTAQGGYKNRFTERDKYFTERRKGLPCFILASNQAGSDLNYVQFWDGTLIPGKCVRAYYPTSPLWWYRHDAIGGITRSGGHEGIHFNDAGSGGFGGSNEYGYGGNVTTASFHSIQGWLPLDKEVVRAFFCFNMSYQPDCPPVGRTQKGGPMHDRHWHSFTSETFKEGMGEDHQKYDNKMLASVMGWSDDVNEEGHSGGDGLTDGNYIPLNYNGEQYVGGEEIISKYNDETFGFGITQNWLEWAGFGEDIIQKATEESIWKKYTFDEFKNIENQYTYDVEFEIGDPTEDGSVQGTVSYMPKPIADGLINNIGQGITNMFNLSGLNSSGIFDKDGMDLAEKTVNTDWAEGGQIIIQSDEDSNADTVLNNSVAALGVSNKIDVTKLVRKLYNKRIDRDFNVATGTAYSGIWDWIKSNKVDYKGDSVDTEINYRHYNNSIGGYWLNSTMFFPELEEGKFPTIDNGMEYTIKPKNICDLGTCGSFYIEMISNEDNDSSNSSSDSSSKSDSKDYTENDPEYYKYSPHVLCFSDSEGKPSSGAFDKNFKVIDGDWSKCKMMSSSIGDLYFVLNISGYPTQTSHRPYRNESGSWNLSNAICPNKDCFVNRDGRTVAEAATLSAAGKSMYRNYMFNLYSEKCGACRTDLTKAKGAIYTGGDGIETWEYKDIPQTDCIINGFIVELENTVGKCGFDVYGMASTDSYWEKLITVDYDYDSNQYIWREYLDRDFVKKSGSTLPVFKGIWKDGYNAAKDRLTGYHFLAKRCNKIKVVGRPCRKRSNGEPLPNGGRVEELTDVLTLKSSNIVSGSKASFKTGLNNLTGCEGGMLEIYLNGTEKKDLVFSSEIRSYNVTTRTLGLANPLPDSLISKFLQESNSSSSAQSSHGSNSQSEEKTDKYYYCIRLTRYIFTIKKFQVYGLELCDNVKITADAETIVLPIQKGVVSMPFYDRASKILRSMAINGNTSMYEMKDMGDNEALTSDNLFYMAEYDTSSKKYRITGGQFFYDTFTNLIYLPYRARDIKDGTLIKDENNKEIDNVYTSDKIFQDTIPTAIEFKYMVNAGASIDLDIISKGEGPSYALERDTITEFAESSLPPIGKSVFFRKNGGRVDMQWMASNKVRTRYECSEPYLTGLELASGVTQSSFKEFIGGNDETKNGLDSSKNFLFGGKATGQITLTGLPNCIISGILCMRAPAYRTRTYTFGKQTVITKERTGGMSETGFIFIPKVKVRAPDGSGQSLACLAGDKPTLVVYLAERDVTQELEE